MTQSAGNTELRITDLWTWRAMGGCRSAGPDVDAAAVNGPAGAYFRIPIAFTADYMQLMCLGPWQATMRSLQKVFR